MPDQAGAPGAAGEGQPADGPPRTDGGPASGPAAPDAVRLWGGRFAAGPAAAVARLSRSIEVDWRLAQDDLAGSRAHLEVLYRAGLLSDSDRTQLAEALTALSRDVARGSFGPDPADEDVHTALERGLLERVGPLAGRLRAGRSRNDQVATDLRRYVRREARRLAGTIADLESALIGQARRHPELAMPGFTHLQHAQPVLFAHHLLAHVQAFARDVDRLIDWDRRAAVCPLGAGALAGSSLPLDPAAVAHELGFAAPAGNSLDAVADRDFVAEFCFVAALLGVHLSRLGEEIVLWCSQEFSWITLDDRYATGSSIMPQKKNPDVAELARGKAGRLIGDLTTVLVVLKGLPLAYDRDLQEDKEPAFDSLDTLSTVLPALTGLVATMQVHEATIAAAAGTGHALATDVAEWLVRRGVPFRQAHEVVGALVAAAVRSGQEFADLDDAELAAVSPVLDPTVRSVLDVRGAIAARAAVGGTAPHRVAEQLAVLEELVGAHRAWAESGGR